MNNMLLLGVVGSKAYGLDRPDSDTDTLGVFARPTLDFLGLNPPQLSHASQGGEGDDSALHEVGKFLKMVLSCNPTTSELLWLPDDLYLTRTPAGERLIEMREAFLFAKGVRNAYLGYAHSQVKRVKRDFATPGRKEKAARHALRLVETGTTLWMTGQMDVRVADRERIMEFGRKVASGNFDLLDKMLADAEETFANRPTPLPDSNLDGLELADAWLRRFRMSELQPCAS